MEKHFQTFLHWYDTAEIAQKSFVKLNLINLVEDKALLNNWRKFFEELKTEPSQTLACIGLAMHNVIVKGSDDDMLQHLKIYAR